MKKRSIPNQRKLALRPLWVGALVLGFLAGAVVALGAPRSDESLAEAAGLARLHETDQNEPLLGSGCRLVGSPIEIVESEGGRSLRVTGTIQNAGQKAATIHALQLGWWGDYTLRSVTLDGHEEMVEAPRGPAIIELQRKDGVVVEPGASVRYEILFGRNGDVLWKMGPMVMLTREGCEVALREATKNLCGLSVSGPTLSGSNRQVATFEMVNAGDVALQISELELDWPVEKNGALRAIQSGGQLPPTDFPPSPVLARRSPMLISLPSLLQRTVILEPGQRTWWHFAFEKEAAPESYVLTANARDACRASGGSWLANPYCGTELRRFQLEGETARMSLVNTRGITQTLSALDLLWEDHNNGPLNAVLLDGKSVLREPVAASPAIVNLARPVAVGPGKSVEIAFVFDTGRPGGALQGRGLEEQISGGDFTVIARMRDGCSATLTTLSGEDLGCRVTASDLVRDEKSPDARELTLLLTNTGAKATLSRMNIAWPIHNGALTALELDGVALIDAPVPHASEPVSIALAARAEVERDAPQLLRLRFENEAARMSYMLLLGFQDATGQDCSELLVTSPPVVPDCRLELGNFHAEGDGRVFELDLVSQGQDPLELDAVRIEWPDNGGMEVSKMRRLALIRQDGDEETEIELLATPSRPPVHLRTSDGVGQPATLPRKGRAKLQLVFDQLRDPDGLQEDLKATLWFVEGCKVQYRPGSTVAVPERLRFEATVKGLPAEDMVGTWLLQDTAARPWRIEVGRSTQFVPNNISPREGDMVDVTAAIFEAQGLVAAERIRLLTSRPERVIAGTITALDQAADASRLPAWIEIDTQRVLLETDYTRVDAPDHLTQGATVVAHATLGNAGALVATRIKIAYSALQEPRPIQLKGVVDRILPEDGSSPWEDIGAIWEVDEFQIHVPRSIAEKAGAARPGQAVQVDGELDGKAVHASKIDLIFPPASRTQRLSGILVDVPPSGGLGTWVIEVQDGQRYAMTLGHLGALDTRRAPAEVGNRVVATIRQEAGGEWLALRIRTDRP